MLVHKMLAYNNSTTDTFFRGPNCRASSLRRRPKTVLDDWDGWSAMGKQWRHVIRKELAEVRETL